MKEIIKAVSEYISEEHKASIERRLGESLATVSADESETAFLVMCCSATEIRRPVDDVFTTCYYCEKPIRHSFNAPKKPRKVCERCGTGIMFFLERRQKLELLKVGDEVTRLLGGIIPHKLTITEITEKEIICGAWTFNRENGGEIDLDLGWDGKITTGSYLEL